MTEFIAIFIDNGYWYVGPDYTGNYGVVTSGKTGQSLLHCCSKWQYYIKNDGWKEDDDTLKVTGKKANSNRYI